MQDEKKRHRAWGIEHGVKSIADLGLRIANIKARSQEPGVRRHGGLGLVKLSFWTLRCNNYALVFQAPIFDDTLGHCLGNGLLKFRLL